MAVTWSCKLCNQKNSLDSEPRKREKNRGFVGVKNEITPGDLVKTGTLGHFSVTLPEVVLSQLAGDVHSLPEEQCITCGRRADWKPSQKQGEMEVFRRGACLENRILTHGRPVSG